MCVHAHPDDESSKGAATMAKYVYEGVDVLVVTCTGGERGSVLNPKLQGDPYIEEHIHEVRAKEMDEARQILGVKQSWLGFVDSGLPEGDPLPPLPAGCFALQDVDVAAGALVKLIREFRPHVITTYDENGGYPHPDHVKTHEVTVEAFDDPDVPGVTCYIARARTELAMRVRSLSGAVRDDPERLKDEMVRTLRRYFGDTINKRPIIVPYVMEV